MELGNLPPRLTAPIYGIISCCYLDATITRGEYKTLQALAVIEAAAPRVGKFGFETTTRDFERLTNLTEVTTWRALASFELSGLIQRATHQPRPSVFWAYWANSRLSVEEIRYLTDCQNALREHVEAKRD